MKTTEPQQHNRYTAQDFVCDVLMVICLIAAAGGILEFVGSL